MLGALTGAPGSADKIAEFFHNKTREMMVSEAWTGVGKATKSVVISATSQNVLAALDAVEGNISASLFCF